MSHCESRTTFLAHNCEFNEKKREKLLYSYLLQQSSIQFSNLSVVSIVISDCDWNYQITQKDLKLICILLLIDSDLNYYIVLYKESKSYKTVLLSFLCESFLCAGSDPSKMAQKRSAVHIG